MNVCTYLGALKHFCALQDPIWIGFLDLDLTSTGNMEITPRKSINSQHREDFMCPADAIAPKEKSN